MIDANKISYFVIPGLDRNVTSKEDSRSISNDIINMIQNEFPNVDIMAKTRKRENATLRFIAMYLIREKTSLSYEYIGKMFGMTHCAVLHAMHFIENSIKYDKKFQNTYGYLIKEGCSRIVGKRKKIKSEFELNINDVKDFLK